MSYNSNSWIGSRHQDFSCSYSNSENGAPRYLCIVMRPLFQ